MLREHIYQGGSQNVGSSSTLILAKYIMDSNVHIWDRPREVHLGTRSIKTTDVESERPVVRHSQRIARMR